MSSLTAMQIFPQSASKVEAPWSPRQTSVRGVPCAYCTKITLRRFESGSCIATRRTPLTASRSRRWVRNNGSIATFLSTLDSLGVTWLMIEAKTGERL
jgi:hypothetical protein